MAEKVTRALFDLQAIGTRLSTTRFFSTEMSWWSDLDGDILGTVILDSTDQDFVRIPEHSASHSINIRTVIPEYPATPRPRLLSLVS